MKPRTVSSPSSAARRRRRPTERPAVLIVGAGGHGRVVLDILHQARRYHALGFLDNNPASHGRRVDGLRVLGGIDRLPDLAHELGARGAIVAVGDNGARRDLARQIEQAGVELINAVHPTASLAQTVSLGRNVVLAAGVVVCAHCQIGDSVILNTGCIVDHQTMIGAAVHVCPGVRIAGRVKVESGAFLGIGATVVPKVEIGCEAVVGAGAVVIHDVPALATVVGVPARIVRAPAHDDDLSEMLAPLRRTGLLRDD
jgi:sugar O-acyltransferase (sialic acid O-acetyltransferase NeuD family)